MNEAFPAPSPEDLLVNQIEQLIAQLDASLPKVALGGSLPSLGITPEQFDSLTATW